MWTYCVEGVVVVAVLDVEPLDGLELVFVLPNASERDPQAVVEPGVGDGDVCAVRLEGDAVVAVVDGPVVELNVRGADGVCPVCVGWKGVSVCLQKSEGTYSLRHGFRCYSQKCCRVRRGGNR